MFRAAVLRLTLWYLALIMLLSASFSLALYRVSANELIANQNRQQSLLRRSFFLSGQPPNFDQFILDRQQQLDDSEGEIETNLVYFNIIILLAGGGISYLLALRTLQPIERAVEAQRRFTADASHELRTPLTAIKTELEVALRDDRLTLQDSRELHRSTLEEVGKLESLSNGLLRLAQHDNKPSDGSFQVIPVHDILQEARKRVLPAAVARHISISIGPTELHLEAERWRAVELLCILLDNAVKYSGEGAEVRVSAALRNHGQQVAIAVADTGRGIEPQDLPHIFERFYRSDRSRTKDGSAGYGLGLAIAKQIADQYRGSIEVKSEPGIGSTFTAVLPVRQHPAWPKRHPSHPAP